MGRDLTHCIVNIVQMVAKIVSIEVCSGKVVCCCDVCLYALWHLVVNACK